MDDYNVLQFYLKAKGVLNSHAMINFNLVLFLPLKSLTVL